MLHSTVIRAGFEPIAGYILRQRLGAGGYGEVWSADAPGGLQKAIKLVYGTLDEHRASSELRSLQRLRQVHHPLLLSLERIEIVDGQLIIVTELAEGSLVDRFHASRRRQQQGIPRDQLLDFLRDAADALDFLSQKHDLQHLDVKPGNLLLMADRIKVADFGLIKDLHDPNVSIVSGLTPSHAAPELFDGRPDRLSDLYSLAVVYQEMLTGKLPFDGKTPGELARQHLHSPPNLEPLPPADRRVVARALAKHPLDRYPSCRVFIEELRLSGSNEKYSAKGRSFVGEFDTRSDVPIGENTKSTSTCTSPALLGGLQIMPPLPTADSAEGWQAPLCMFIGVGGMGCRAIAAVRGLLEQKIDQRRQAKEHQWLAIDTDFDLLSEICSLGYPGAVDYANTCHINLRRPQDYRQHGSDRFTSISRRWLYNIPRSLKTDGVRPLGMLALVDHQDDVESRLAQQLKELLATRQAVEGKDCQPIRIAICNSIHGGTGSAISAYIGRMVRNVLAQLNCTDYLLSSSVSIAMTQGSSGGLPAAAALATLCELDALMDGGQFVPELQSSAPGKASGSGKPFDWVSLIDGGIYGQSDDVTRAIIAMAEALWVDSHTLVGSTLDATRRPRAKCWPTQTVDSSNAAMPISQSESVAAFTEVPAWHGRSWLRATRCSLVQLGNAFEPIRVTRICSARAIQRWHACMTSGSHVQGGQDFHQQTLNWSPAQTSAIIEQLSSECLIVLRANPSSLSPSSDAQSNNSPWRNRASENSEIVRLQLERDTRECRKWLADQMRPSYISWKMIQRILLRAVERLLSLAACDEVQLAVHVNDPQSGQEPFNPTELKNIRRYIELLAGKCVEQLQLAQGPIEHLVSMLGAWANSLQAEHPTHDTLTGIDLTTSQLPIGWRQIMSRIDTVLDKTLHRFVTESCFRALGVEAAPADASVGTLSLGQLLRLSGDLVDRLTREAGMDCSSAVEVGNSSGKPSVVLQEVDSLVPAAANRGGRLYRLLAITPSQFSQIEHRLKQLDMHASCTMVPARFGEDPVAVCDATDLNLPGLIHAFWKPTPEIFHLAERLHTRCDIAWPNIDLLLASSVDACAAL